MNIIFLDFDGVLKPLTNYWNQPERFLNFKPSCVKCFKKIVQNHDIKLVISSAWRIMYGEEEVKCFLKEYGIHNEVIGFTPVTTYNNTASKRGSEIISWLIKNKTKYSIKKFLIIDDKIHESISQHFRHNEYYETSSKTGLTVNDIKHLQGVWNEKTNSKKVNRI